LSQINFDGFLTVDRNNEPSGKAPDQDMFTGLVIMNFGLQ